MAARVSYCSLSGTVQALGLLLILLAGYSGAQLPDGWKSCKTGAADYSDCLKKEITNAIQSLQNGNKAVGVIPVEPLVIEKLSLEESNKKKPVAIDMTFTNVRVHGLSQAVIDSVQNDWKVMKISGSISEINIDTDYEVTGKVLVLPISGKGPGKLIFKDVKFTEEFAISQVEKNGKQYYQVDNVNFSLKPKSVVFKFDNLFNGDQNLGNNMNSFLNKNWRVIFKEVGPPVKAGLSQLLKQIANQVFSKIPADQINPQ